MANLYGALLSGVSGLKAQSTAMSAIADNVSNVNTVGYKASNTQFSTLVTRQYSKHTYTSGGVLPTVRTDVCAQGVLNATGGMGDLALSGDGFFVVSSSVTGGPYYYTRAGQFSTDEAGYLQNVAGYYMQGWTLQLYDRDRDGTNVETLEIEGKLYKRSYINENGVEHHITSTDMTSQNMRPLNLGSLGGLTVATSSITLQANLNAQVAADGSEGSRYNLNLPFYDTLGISHTLGYTWTKTGTNTWDSFVEPLHGAYSTAMKSQNGEVYMSAGRIDFTSMPGNGSSFKITVNGEEYTIQYAETGTETDPATIDDDGTTPILIRIKDGTNDVTLEDVLEKTQAVLNAIISAQNIDAYSVSTGSVGEVTGGKEYPASWVTMTKSPASLVFYNSFATGIDVDMTNMKNANTGYCVLQTGTYTVAGLDLADSSGASNWNGAWINRDDKGVLFATQDSDKWPCSIRFDTDGSILEIMGYNQQDYTDPTTYLVMDWANGSSRNQVVAQNWGNYHKTDGMSQNNSSFETYRTVQDGREYGTFQSIEVSEGGVVIATFSNGVRRAVFQIPIATFSNANGLDGLSGTLFAESNLSGTPTLKASNTGTTGKIVQGALESSTADVAEEFTDMIITQRAYSAATRIITTTDDMLTELLRIKQ